nr:immunoglobulin light chain junction region [Macaca mulatta]
CHQYNSGPLTF